MTLAEIKEKYYIRNVSKNLYYISHLTEYGRLNVHKYLATVKRKGAYYSVEGNKPTNDINTFVQQIEAHVASLPYNSDLYYPNFREGILVEMVIFDYIVSLGFEEDSSGYSHTSDYYNLKRKDVYGGNTTQICLCIHGLNGLTQEFNNRDKNDIKVSIVYNDGAWVEIKTNKDILEIKKAIDSLLKPLMVTESIAHLDQSETLENYSDLEILSKRFEGMTIKSEEYKSVLKSKLTEMLAVLG